MQKSDPNMANLFLVGASKTGSSSLHTYLSHHPEIIGALPKEPCYFVEQSELKGFWASQALDPVSHDRAAYLAMFEGQGGAYRLDSSVFYSQVPHFTGIAARIAEASPDARIIYVVRHPVTRSISHYWQRFREMHEARPIDEAVVEGSVFVDTSNYAEQMKAYLEYFDRSRIKVILSEDLLNNRKAVLDDIFSWLGLETLEMDSTLEGKRHTTKENTRIPRLSVIPALRDSTAWQTVRKALPMSVVRRIRALAVKEVPRAEVDETAVRAFLKGYFEQRAGAFDALMGVDFERRWFPDLIGAETDTNSGRDQGGH